MAVGLAAVAQTAVAVVADAVRNAGEVDARQPRRRDAVG